MKSWFAFLLALAVVLGPATARAADSVVVFNEIHYHPVTNETALEWVELHNQMAVDIDLSAWRLAGSVDYSFPEGTIIFGGGQLVIAADPTALRAATGATNIVGPFTGRLNNSGARLELRDRNDRLMDRVDYSDEGKWPVAPDGSGATLAKRHPDLASGRPENWTSGVLVAGTPGRRNFPAANNSRLISLVGLESLWRYQATGPAPDPTWKAPGFDDSSWAGRNSATLVSYWPFNGNATATRGTAGSLIGAVATVADRNGAAGGALGFNGGLSQYVSVPGGGGLDGAAAGTISLWVRWVGTQDGDCCGGFGAVLARQANGQFSDDILALNGANPATARIVWRQSGGPAPVLITGSRVVGTNWHHVAITFASTGSVMYVDGTVDGTGTGSGMNRGAATPLSIGAWAGDGGGFLSGSLDDVAIWDRPLGAAQIAQLASQTRTPLDFAIPESAVYFSGDGRLASNDELRHTEVPVGPVTAYFRQQFQYTEDRGRTTLALDLAVDDGAVVYLNGAEVYRHNLPPGEVTAETLAVAPVGNAPMISGIRLPGDLLLPGANLLAVEVHQAAPADSGMVFGAGLTATLVTETNDPASFEPGTVVFNEVRGTNGSFAIELFNRGAAPVDLGGYVIRRTGGIADASVVLPAQSVEPGGLVLLDAGALGFNARPGDKLFLYKPGGSSVADAVEVQDRTRARWPDGGAEWRYPDPESPGTANTFRFRDDVVINELFYHAPPSLEVPAVTGTTQFLTFTNTWRFEQSGTDLGTAWRAPGYDDSGWAAGPAMFYVSTANLAVPKNTPLTLGPTTYYFRTTVVITNPAAMYNVALRHMVDDGAVFYVNGVEILRFNIPAGNVSYTNRATASVGTPTVRTIASIPLTNFVAGTNYIAMEVHQASNPGSDVVAALEMTASVNVSPRILFSENPQQWLELHNRGTQAVSLAGWRLDELVDYRFATNAAIPAGGYLVVARDPASLQASWPGIPIAGPWSGRLSGSGGRVVLRDPAGNPADVVEYYDSGRWPETPDGGGSSLELRNPGADNSIPENWAASDERGRSGWRTYTYRGIAQASAVGPDGQWREFVMGLLEAGEVWLDDISVVETPSTTPVQMIQNGTFNSGTNTWRIIGNHHGDVIDDPDLPGNKILRLVATGSTDHMSNHGETTFSGGRDVVNGREYQISFRARWISGSRQLHTRLYFNRLARVVELDAPAVQGTPGAVNSTFAANLGPSFNRLRHQPVVPAPFVPVTVSVEAADPHGVTSLTLWSRPDGGSWTPVPMVPTGGPATPGYAAFAATLAGRAAGSVVQFYVEGTDGLGTVARMPAAGASSRALYQVDNGLAAVNGLHNLRLVTLVADANALHDPITLMSNERIGSTLIYDESEIYYNVGLRLKGSEHSRTTSARLGFNVGFGADQLFRGIHKTVAIDRSESTGFGQREILIHQTENHAGGLPTKYNDLIQVLAPRAEHTGAAELQLARYSDVFLDAQYPDGGDGTVYEYELIYQLNGTHNGNPEGNKVPNPDSYVGTPIRNLGTSKEGYRWNFLIKNNETRDDFQRLSEFCAAMELSGTSFLTTISNYIDADQWLRGTAIYVLAGCGDSYPGDGTAHNVQLYVRPSDGRVLLFPHDLDAFFDAGRSIVPNSDFGKIIASPANARAYYAHLQEIIATTYNTTYLNRWATHFGKLLPAQNFAGHLAFVGQRVANVNGQIAAAVPNVPFAITTSGGNNFGVGSNVVSLAGSAPLGVRFIEINGVRYPVNWNSLTGWLVTLNLPAGANAIAVRGVDRNGNPVAGAADSVTITNTGTGALLPVVINEWSANNAGPAGVADPLDGLFQDWFELYNPNDVAISLAGWTVTDDLAAPTKWSVPSGTVIPPRGFQLVWADDDAAQVGLGTNGHLHAPFQLRSAGESLGLFNPAGVRQHAVGFNAQFENVSQGFYPDGDTNHLYFMARVTPGGTNRIDGDTRIVSMTHAGGVVILEWSTIPGRTYRVESAADVAAPAWEPRGDVVVADDKRATWTETVPAGLVRFYRVIRLD